MRLLVQGRGSGGVRVGVGVSDPCVKICGVHPKKLLLVCIIGSRGVVAPNLPAVSGYFNVNFVVVLDVKPITCVSTLDASNTWKIKLNIRFQHVGSRDSSRDHYC